MKNFFFAPSKATADSDDMLRYLQSVGKVRVAEPDSKKNRETLRRLKLSTERTDVELAVCVLSMPTDNALYEGGTAAQVGRGIYDIGQDALYQEIPTFLLRKDGEQWFFYPVIHISQESTNVNWKTNYARLMLELPIGVACLGVYLQTLVEEREAARLARQANAITDDEIPF